ncbi:zinc knuckle CX2CX4HX4C containing protein [Tanacetum coccineum]
MNKRKAFNVSIQYEHGDVLVAHMQRMTGNDGNAAAKQPRMPIRGLKNPNSESVLKDTNNSLSPTMESLVPEGDHINVSSYAGRTKPGLNEALKSVKTNVTSFGESTNPSWSTMNPSSVINSDVEQNIWSSSVPTGLNAANTSAKGIFTSFGESTNPSLSMNVPAESFEAEDAVPVPTGWTSYDQPSTAEPNSETPIVKSMDINPKPTSYAGATGVSTKDQTKVEANFCSLVADKVFDGRMAFLVVEYYAKNNWAKHGLKRIMMNAKGFFFFKFGTRAGLEAVLEGEPDLKESITIGIADLDGPGFTKETIRVEYEWKPPRCQTCNIFGHTVESCPKKVVTTPVVNNTMVSNKLAPKAGFNSGGTRSEVNSKAGSSKNTKEGAYLTEKSTFTDRQKDKDVVDTGQMKMSNITTPNTFIVLGEVEEEEVENIWDESENLNLQNTRASTPTYTVPDV